MPKFQHDEFAKSYLTELLNTIGKATPNHRIKSETREADLWFELNPKSQSKRHALGLLGQLLTRNALIEVFRNPASAPEIRSCIEELLTDYRAKLESLGQQLTQEDEELIMNLSAAYIKKQQEWLEEGKQEGRQENRRETAIAALRKGYSSDVIMDLTGLSIEELEKLRASLN
jgi:hypothetical protein